jgi:hypothetical protein
MGQPTAGERVQRRALPVRFHYLRPKRHDAEERPLSNAYLWLMADEAQELRGAPDDLLAHPRADWHAHVATADFQTVSVAWDDRG